METKIKYKSEENEVTRIMLHSESCSLSLYCIITATHQTLVSHAGWWPHSSLGPSCPPAAMQLPTWVRDKIKKALVKYDVLAFVWQFLGTCSVKCWWRRRRIGRFLAKPHVHVVVLYCHFVGHWQRHRTAQQVWTLQQFTTASNYYYYFLASQLFIITPG